MTEPVKHLTGLADILERYDAFIVDIWGVLHDGVRAYPEVPHALARLKQAGKRVALLSNSPGRAAIGMAALDRMGIAPELYDRLLTSGEAVFEALRDRADPFHASIGRSLFHIGPQRDVPLFEGLDHYRRLESPDGADAVVVTAVYHDTDPVDAYDAVLDACLWRGLPMICANPDLVVMVGAVRVVCPGQLAQRYEARGGRVAWHGKPFRPAYDRALRALGDPDPARVLAVGDSLRTDVGGARGAGLDVAFVPGGIHRDDLGIEDGAVPHPDRLAALLARYPDRPTWLLPRLKL